MSRFGEELVDALGEAVRHMNGQQSGLVTHVVRVPEAVDVLGIRKRTGLSRARFAERFGLDKRAVQDWEQGRRRPDLAARILLLVIDKHPEAVEDALHAAA